jgi:hypothetical protein
MKRRILLAVPFAIVGLAIVRYTPAPDSGAMTRDVQRLAQVVAVVDEVGLTNYRDEDGCQSIAYRGGEYISDLTGTMCEFTPNDGSLFTDGASADVERVRRSLADTGVGVIGMYVMDAYEPDAGGNNRQIVFDLAERTPDAWSYVYEPGHSSWTDSPAGIVEIDANWFFVAREPNIQ